MRLHRKEAKPVPVFPVSKLDEDWAARLRGLTDAVFAIVLTLLVLNLDSPNLAKDIMDPSVQQGIQRLGEQLFGYFLTYSVIGSYWIAHCRAFRGRFHIGMPLLAFNLSFLFFLSLLPFTTDMMTTYLNSHFAWWCYTVNVVFIGLFHTAMVLRVDYREHIVRDVARARTRVSLVAPVLFAISFAVAPFSLPVAHIVPFAAWPIIGWMRSRWPTDEPSDQLQVDAEAVSTANLPS
jgi:uncharacterized membrane protein